MKKKKVPPTLTSVDLGLIRAMLITECAPLNKAERKKLRALEKEVRELKWKVISQSVNRDAPVFKFLLGEGAMPNGLWFGQQDTQTAGEFYWRKALREALGLTTKPCG